MSRWNEHEDHGRRLKNVAHRGYITAIDQTGKIQRVKMVGWNGTENETIDHIQPHGFTSNPGAGDKVEALMLDIAGDASHRVAIAVFGDRAKHLQVPEGHAALYSPSDPTQVWSATPQGLTANAPGQSISFKSQSHSVEATNISFKGTTSQTGDMSVKGNFTHTGDMAITGNVTINGTLNGVPV